MSPAGNEGFDSYSPDYKSSSSARHESAPPIQEPIGVTPFSTAPRADVDSGLQNKHALSSATLRKKEKMNMLDTIATEIISSLQLPDHLGDAYPGFLHVAVGQLLRKLDETETQRKNHETKRESVGTEISPVKSQKLNELIDD